MSGPPHRFVALPRGLTPGARCLTIWHPSTLDERLDASRDMFERARVLYDLLAPYEEQLVYPGRSGSSTASVLQPCSHAPSADVQANFG